MSLVFRKPKTQEQNLAAESEEWDFSTCEDEEKLEKLDLQITALCGANRDNFQLAGQSVASARRFLAPILNIEPGAAALVNGQEVKGNRILQPHDQLEFVRKAGEKGSADGRS